MVCRLLLAPGPLRFNAFSLLLLPVLLGVGCRPPAQAGPEISIQQQISPQPVRVGLATLNLQLADPIHKPISHAAIEVEADMAHPGMAPLFATAEETSPGSYRANLHFDMPGDWVVSLRIKLPSGQVIERTMDVRGIRNN